MPEIESVDARGASQTVKALLSMRELLLTGELAPGQRVSEIWAVDRLGVSRTPVRSALARLEEEGFLEALPFAHPSGFVHAQSQNPDFRTIFILAQDHHRAVVDAIRHREGARAEALMREHARLAARNLRAAIDNQPALGLVAGGQLLRTGGG